MCGGPGRPKGEDSVSGVSTRPAGGPPCVGVAVCRGLPGATAPSPGVTAQAAAHGSAGPPTGCVQGRQGWALARQLVELRAGLRSWRASDSCWFWPEAAFSNLPHGPPRRGFFLKTSKEENVSARQTLWFYVTESEE